MAFFEIHIVGRRVDHFFHAARCTIVHCLSFVFQVLTDVFLIVRVNGQLVRLRLLVLQWGQMLDGEPLRPDSEEIGVK